MDKVESLPPVPRGRSPTPFSEEKLRRAITGRVKLNHLRIFVEVARQENVSRAARLLNLAQPAVTKTLRELEDILATELFERRARGVILTDSGRLVLPHAETMLTGLARIGDQITSFLGGWSGSVTIGATMAALPHLLPRALADPKILETQGVVRVVEGNIDPMLRALRRGDIDLLVGRLPGPQDDDILVQELVLDDPFVPVVAASHPLAAPGVVITTKQLSDFPWIMPPYGSSAAEPLHLYMIANNIRPASKVIETVSYQAIQGLLENSELIAILPRHLARLGVMRGTLHIVGPALEKGGMSIGITYSSDRPLTPLALLFVNAFRDAASKVMP
ncbi:MAG: LysR family transcriptional regulator [Proteobacteria bacterium]|nr:LysR family transcriptional regulator [Pseudomonadota bacterium]